MTERRRSVIEHGQDARRQDREWSRSDTIKAIIETCSRALGDAPEPHARGGAEEYRYVHRECLDGVTDDALVALLERHTGRGVTEYAGAGLDRYDAVAVRRLVGGYTDGFDGADRHLRQTVFDAFQSLVAIAEHEDVIQEEYASTVDVSGFSRKLGAWQQKEEMYVGDPVYGVSWQSGGLLTLFGGRPGYGKSAGVERDVEDLYCYDPETADLPLQETPVQPFKVIDLVDLEKGETWFYDIPQHQDRLREIREDHGLPPDFTELEDDPDREIEIYAPLTADLGDLKLPYDVDREAFTVKPFAIPASDIPRDILTTAILTRVSNDEERTIKNAWGNVDNEREDWAIKHLADEIRDRDDLSTKHKAGAINVLQELQDQGFIRTEADAPTVEWDRVFQETDTVTVFTQAQQIVPDPFGKMFLIAYLLDKIIRERSGQRSLAMPELVLVMRELWEVVPHNRRDVDDDQAADLQSVIGNRTAKLCRKNRHYTTNVVGDTQYPYDLDNAVREAFNRYVIYTGTSKLAKGVTSWTGREKPDVLAGTLTTKKGEASVIGEVQAAIDNPRVEFIGPVSYVPASHHHWQKGIDGAGWVSRTKYLTPIESCPECDSDALDRGPDGVAVTCQDCGAETRDLSMGRREELREPDWETDVPEHLNVDDYSKSDDEADGEEDESDAPKDPKTYHREEARRRNRRGESIRQIRENIPNNPDTGEPYSIEPISRWVSDVNKGEALDDE